MAQQKPNEPMEKITFTLSVQRAFSIMNGLKLVIDTAPDPQRQVLIFIFGDLGEAMVESIAKELDPETLSKYMKKMAAHLGEEVPQEVIQRFNLEI